MGRGSGETAGARGGRVSQSKPRRPASAQTSTSAAELMLIAYSALSPAEQEEVFERIAELRLERLAGEESETARFIRSLRLVSERLGHRDLSANDYRDGYRELLDQGAEVEEFNRVVRHFGSWRRAKEALGLAEAETPRKIDARFRSRRLGKVWRYTGETLRETMAACVAHYGHVPQVAEFEWWRERELQKARAEGNDALHLPSATPYRRRYGSWEAALLHFGYTPDEVAERLERQ